MNQIRMGQEHDELEGISGAQIKKSYNFVKKFADNGAIVAGNEQLDRSIDAILF